MAKIKICIESGCQNVKTTRKYCRLHYLKNWKKLKEETSRKAADKLNRYVEGICKKHPENYMDAIKKDLKNEKSFARGMGADPAGGDGFRDEIDEIMEDLGYKDDTSIDRLIANIKIGSDYK